MVRVAGIAGVGAIVFFVLNYYTALANAGGTVSQLEAGLGGSFSLGVGIWVVLGGAVILFLNGKGKR